DLDVIELDEDEDIEEIEVDEDEEIEEIEIDDDEDLDVIELDEDEDIEEIEIDEDEEIEEIEIDDDEDLDVIELDEDEDIEEIELADDEVIEDIEGGLPIEDDQEEFKLDDDGDTENKKRLSEQFESYLGAMEKFYNQYLRVSAGKYIVGTKHPKPSEIEEQTFFTPEIYVGKFPVTNALFEVFVNKTGYITTAEKRGYGNVYSGKFQKKTDPKTGITKSVWNATYKQKTVNGACWYQPFGPGSNLHNKKGHPVVQISLDDANMFAAWIGKRLPSEFEWEAAARTEKGYILPWGDEWENEKCNTENLGIADTTSVETFIDHENALGICDTIGNVLEWTVNECVPPYFSNKNSAYYIAKGGSFISDNTVRLYTRFMFKSDFTSNILGFRCVAD
ncbi:MAG: formylglycine-generating enzyme family protein, partial [Proteobacteria bacterium]|nr:formylglycine-generating enzyme family protein [Pseudomonadota bacterium]